MDFVYKVEWQMPRFVQVDALEVIAYEDGLVPGSTMHDFDVTLITYTYAGSGAPAAGGESKPAGGN